MHPAVWSRLAVVCCLVSLVAGGLPGVVGPVRATPAGIVDGFNGSVLSTASGDGITYVAGGFTAWGPQTGGGALVDAAAGTLERSFADFAGEVMTSVSDGAGGLYVGGYFDSVGSHDTARIAHLRADGSVDTGFRVHLNDGVRALVLRDGVLYAGGGFTCVGAARIPNDDCDATGDVERYYLAAFTSTGVLLDWNPRGTGPQGDSAGYHVAAMALAGSTLYVGGYFAQFGPTGATVTRSRLAAFDLASGTPSVPTSWDPNAWGAVTAMAVSGGTLYVGGSFVRFGSGSGEVPRNRLAAFDISSTPSTTPSAWDPDADGDVAAMAVSGTVLYVAGAFQALGTDPGSVTAHGLAAFDIASTPSSTPMAWDPGADAPVSGLLVTDSTVYFVGAFDHVQGLPRSGAAAVSTLPNATVLDWNPNLDATGRTVAMLGSRIFVGGEFATLNDWVQRKGLASLTSSGTLTSWAPIVDAYVSHLLLSGNRLYALGNFSLIDGITRKGLAAFALPSGTLTSWDPNATRIYYGNSVHVTMESFAIADGIIYVAGDFTSIGGQPRIGLAAVDAQTAAVTAWAPDAPLDATGDQTYVFDLLVSGNVVYVAGSFASIGSDPRGLMAAVDRADGSTLPWNPRLDGVNITQIALVGSTVVFGGRVTCMGQDTPGTPCTDAGETALQGLGGADVVTAASVPGWNHQFSFENSSPGYPRDFASAGGVTYLAGEFALLDGRAVGNLAAFTSSGAVLTDWQPMADSGVESIEVSGSTVTVGGGFTRLNGQGPRFLQNLAVAAPPAPAPAGGGGGAPTPTSAPSPTPSPTASTSSAATSPVSPAPAPTPAPTSATPSSTRRSLGGGVTVVSGPAVSRVKATPACGTPGRSVAAGPATSATVKSIVKVKSFGMPRSSQVRARMRIDGTWTFMGRVNSNENGAVTAPAFIATRSGRYPIELTPANGPRRFTTVAVGAAGRMSCAR